MEPDVEEVCNWWSQVEGSEFAQKELVRKNFIESFVELFNKEVYGEIDFEQFDFRLIKEHLEKQKEIRNSRTAEEKRLETQKKQE